MWHDSSPLVTLSGIENKRALFDVFYFDKSNIVPVVMSSKPPTKWDGGRTCTKIFFIFLDKFLGP